jgi:phage shock protein PspC (stress-responsive transcriptional regulator)
MNEVTRIHLGRQPFTISVEAHKALKDYLAEIKKQVADSDVVNEVELRMAELLGERGISGDKVILATDVDYLKQQLGNPKDFKDDGDEAPAASNDQSAKRLFRDTDNAMVAGVASGLANYFGVDVLLIRILFAVGTIAWGGGILLYIALWLLVPPAKTSSERLQMQGKPVTIDGLKEVVDRADIPAAAHRANTLVAPVLGRAIQIVLKVAALGFMLAGLAALLGLFALRVYLSLHSDNIENLFPVGASEHLLLNIGFITAGLVSLFIILAGIAIFRLKWPVRSWITGMLVGLFFICLAAGIALGANAAPNVVNRYDAATHTTYRQLQPYSTVYVIGNGINVNYQQGDKYEVKLHYYGNPDLSRITTNVVGGQLQINSQNFDWRRHNCNGFCLIPTYNMEVTFISPTVPNISYPQPPDFPYPPKYWQ